MKTRQKIIICVWIFMLGSMSPLAHAARLNTANLVKSPTGTYTLTITLEQALEKENNAKQNVTTQPKQPIEISSSKSPLSPVDPAIRAINDFLRNDTVLQQALKQLTPEQQNYFYEQAAAFYSKLEQTNLQLGVGFSGTQAAETGFLPANSLSGIPIGNGFPETPSGKIDFPPSNFSVDHSTGPVFSGALPRMGACDSSEAVLGQKSDSTGKLTSSDDWRRRVEYMSRVIATAAFQWKKRASETYQRAIENTRTGDLYQSVEQYEEVLKQPILAKTRSLLAQVSLPSPAKKEIDAWSSALKQTAALTTIIAPNYAQHPFLTLTFNRLNPRWEAFIRELKIQSRRADAKKTQPQPSKVRSFEYQNSDIRLAVKLLSGSLSITEELNYDQTKQAPGYYKIVAPVQ